MVVTRVAVGFVRTSVEVRLVVVFTLADGCMLAADLPKAGCDAGAVLVTASVVVGSITVVTVVLTGSVVVLLSPAVSPRPSSNATTTPNSRLAPASSQRWRWDSLAPCSGLCSRFGIGGKIAVG